MAHWTRGLFDCFSGVCAWCCPCVMYSRVQYRMSHPEDFQMSSFSSCNTLCWGWYCLTTFTGCGGICLQCFQRKEIREKLDIEGSSGKDLLLSCCCHCCVYVQSDEELKAPQQRQRLMGNPNSGYQQQQPMTYAAPPQQQPMAYAAPQQQQPVYAAQ